MTLTQGALVLLSALVGGALNSVAGGGSFLTFPALLLCGVPPIQANATSTAALVPGSLASALAYRLTLRDRILVVLSLSSLVGGVLGALLLLRTPSAVFARLVPYLLLLATVLFAAGGPIGERLRARGPQASPVSLGASVPVQLAIAIYGGFFGGGIGILMLALLALLGVGDLHRMNAIKAFQAAIINGVALVTFVAAGVVHGPLALPMAIAAVVGGYGGARLARRLPVRLVRRFVILVGTAMTALFLLGQRPAGATVPRPAVSNSCRTRACQAGVPTEASAAPPESLLDRGGPARTPWLGERRGPARWECPQPGAGDEAV
ncbi:MAG: sulfite exporter TauE/SafE family protein [Myxococcales bacterium]|nr:sulfite exporter TauE/SafE family protein [Myxococcales bacterium]